jgi:hypothetical protein
VKLPSAAKLTFPETSWKLGWVPSMSAPVTCPMSGLSSAVLKLAALALGASLTGETVMLMLPVTEAVPSVSV